MNKVMEYVIKQEAFTYYSFYSIKNTITHKHRAISNILSHNLLINKYGMNVLTTYNKYDNNYLYESASNASHFECYANKSQQMKNNDAGSIRTDETKVIQT